MCSDLAENTSRAAELSTNCKRHVSELGRPASTELQKSNLLTIRACISDSRASRDSEQRTLLIHRSAEKHLTVAVT